MLVIKDDKKKRAKKIKMDEGSVRIWIRMPTHPFSKGDIHRNSRMDSRKAYTPVKEELPSQACKKRDRKYSDEI